MTKNSGFKVGQIIEIRDKSDDEAPKHRIRIVTIESETEIVTEVPTIAGHPMSMHNGSEFELTYYSEASVFTQSIEVVTRFLSGQKVCVRLLLLGEAKRSNRRQYFRLPVLLDGFSRGGSNPFAPMTTTNLSAGGIRFVTLEKYKTGQFIQIKIKLKKDTLDIVGEVISCNFIQDSTRRHDVRVRFEQISTREEQIILKYLFEIQRDIKRKGLA